MGEIDDIFSKPKSETKQSIVNKDTEIFKKSDSTSTTKVSKKKKKKKKDKKVTEKLKETVLNEKEVETIDLSSVGKKATNIVEDPNDDGTFADSRGVQPRKLTDDGYFIYNEDELNLGQGGGK
ncbi:hypothetical protein HDV02_006423 [Globomyces sp. JEL0801]|nr:hypothetical protein HDV02_006423 [Globomyces sp. JEL0801]